MYICMYIYIYTHIFPIVKIETEVLKYVFINTIRKSNKYDHCMLIYIIFKFE